jgi:Redoxin
LPSIDRLADEYRGRGLEVVLVNMGEAEDKVRAAVKSRGYRARIALDADLDVSRQYGVRGTPTVFLVSRRGLIVGRAIGIREWTGAPARAVIEALLAERP